MAFIKNSFGIFGIILISIDYYGAISEVEKNATYTFKNGFCTVGYLFEKSGFQTCFPVPEFNDYKDYNVNALCKLLSLHVKVFISFSAIIRNGTLLRCEYINNFQPLSKRPIFNSLPKKIGKTEDDTKNHPVNIKKLPAKIPTTSKETGTSTKAIQNSQNRSLGGQNKTKSAPKEVIYELLKADYQMYKGTLCQVGLISDAIKELIQCLPGVPTEKELLAAKTLSDCGTLADRIKIFVDPYCSFLYRSSTDDCVLVMPR